jgi:hypothetical protein
MIVLKKVFKFSLFFTIYQIYTLQAMCGTTKWNESLNPMFIEDVSIIAC